MKKIFFKRILAYIIDCVILFFAMLVVNLFIPTFGDVEELNTRLTTSIESYTSGELTVDEFLEESEDISYDIMKATYISSIAGIVVYLLYFVVFQAYNNGQTLGKKWLKLQVVKTDDSNVDMNSLLRRSLFPYGVLVNFILVVALLFASKHAYLSINTILSNIQMIIIFITLIMMFMKDRGIHDYLANTKVIEA